MRKSLWKKVVFVALALCLMLGLSSCGKTTELTLGEKVVVEKYAEFTAENVLVSSKVFPPISGPNPMGWVVEDEGNTYVTIVATIKNLKDEPLTIDDLWSSFSVILDGEAQNGTIIAMVAENGTKLDDGRDIGAGATETVYFITEVEKSHLQKLTEAEFDFGRMTLSLSVDTSKRIALSEALSLKQTYKVKNLGKVIPKSMKFMANLEPSNPGYTYDYYAPQTEDDRLLVLTTKTKNTSKKKKPAYRYLNMMVFVGEDVYLGDVVADDAYSANITSKEKLGAGDQRNVYGLVNLPKSVKAKDIELYVYLDGRYYQYEIK